MNTTDFATILAGLLATIILVDVSVLWLTGRQVPDLLGQLIFGVFGFYFGRAPAALRSRPYETEASGRPARGAHADGAESEGEGEGEAAEAEDDGAGRRA